MFVNARVENIGQYVRRGDVPRGALYCYENGDYEYACLGMYQNLLVSVKMLGGSGNGRMTHTPDDSQLMDRSCQIKGVFHFELFMHNQPEIRALNTDDMHSFGTVISLPHDTNDEGQSHLYVMLGNRPDENLPEHLLLRLTSPSSDLSYGGGVFRCLHHSATVALRGRSRLIIKRSAGGSYA